MGLHDVERKIIKMLRIPGNGMKMFSVTFSSLAWKTKQPVRVGIQAVEERTGEKVRRACGAASGKSAPAG